MTAHQSLHPPSAWLTRWAHLIRPGGRVLDLACGPGRHARWLAESGFDVLAVDREPACIDGLPASVTGRVADLEQGGWPLAGEGPFDGIVVTNYLHRPLWPHLLDALADGGVLVYETFAAGNETVGKPARPDFLLRPGELLDVARGALRVVAYEDGFLERPELLTSAFVQRLCAVREVRGASGVAPPPRYPLPR